MRMWMVDPGIMCHRHLLAEHNELHFFTGHFRKERKISGYITSNCVEPRSIFVRHEELTVEMNRRGYQHASPIESAEEIEKLIAYLPEEERAAKVDSDISHALLLDRCPLCLNNIIEKAENERSLAGVKHETK